ncbi:MAG TPA: kelch repeat-containing protein [Candidatus Limnocylindrales bacterium]
MDVLPLPNGRVLIGHTSGLTGLETTIDEEYDPTTGRVVGVSPLSYSGGTTPVVLQDGRLLLIGGVTPVPDHPGGPPSFLATASIYDPATGTTSPTGSMHSPRSGSHALLLKDGRVLVIGGLGLSSAEIYDPVSGTFTPTGSMASSHVMLSMVLLQDGRVLLIDFDTEIYDPATGTFNPTGPMTVVRNQVQPALLPNGRVLVVGGAYEAVGNTYAELYDPTTGKFSKTGPPLIPLDFATVTTLANGNVLIAGGTGPDDAILSSAELFEP